MVRVENIVVKDGEFSFDYYPENKNIKHFFKYDTNQKRVIEHEKSKEYSSDVYAKHGFIYVKRLVENKKEIPKYQIIAWY
ncbi:MAG: hypothetical protein IJV68_07625 [Clostridia bacterium]|nr:hypothetical protein [Clostridia bacterium]